MLTLHHYLCKTARDRIWGGNCRCPTSVQLPDMLVLRPFGQGIPQHSSSFVPVRNCAGQRPQRNYQDFGARLTYCRAHRTLRRWRGGRYSSSGDSGWARHLVEAGTFIGDDGIPNLWGTL